MRHVIDKVIRCIPHLALVAAMLIPFASSAATVKALSFAIRETHGSPDGAPIKSYMAINDVDFGVFDYAKSNGSGYFISESSYLQNGKNYNVVSYDTGSGNSHLFRFFVYNSDKYVLVNTPSSDANGDNMAAVFQDEFADQYALISVRGTYKDDKVSATLGPVKNYIEGIAAKYPNAKLIVTYNARLSGTYSTTGNSYRDILNTYLTETSSGPRMTCLGRVTNVGGVYMYPKDTPEIYSVSEVSGIGTSYNGTLVTIEIPKYKVIFNDWDGTGLQTNVVTGGESVTPPTPYREGYTFIGWDHPASDFASVTESFTATAQYDIPTLTVLGTPEDLGTADPAYGTTTAIAANDSFIASVEPPVVASSAVERWVCTGYTHYQITDIDTGARTLVQQGDTASFEYTHVWRDEIVWHFTNEWRVAVSSAYGGSVSVEDAWVRNAETLEITATPDVGWEFWGWVGSTNGMADVTATTITPTITAARSLKAIFVPNGEDMSVQYVSKDGSDTNSGYFASAPKLTVQAAVDTLATAPGYGTVYVAPGKYEASKDPNVAVANAISILGATGNPEDVVLRNTSDTSRVLCLNHPGAFVANVIVENGRRYQTYSYGANVAIDSKGGTVSNCVIRGGSWAGMYVRGTGAWLNSTNALLTHCVITNNATSGVSQQPGDSGDLAYGGMFVDIAKGTVANCLIANNRDTGGNGTVTNGRQSQTCGVTVRDGGRLINCTVVTNEARNTGGVYLTSKGVATNVVVAGCVNKCTWLDGNGNPQYTDIGFKGALANASHCASDGGEALNSTCIAGTAEEFFADMAGRDYRPAANSPLVNSGATYDGIAEIDLLGNPRVQGRSVDIGAYESSSRGFYIIVR